MSWKLKGWEHCLHETTCHIDEKLKCNCSLQWAKNHYCVQSHLSDWWKQTKKGYALLLAFRMVLPSTQDIPMCASPKTVLLSGRFLEFPLQHQGLFLNVQLCPPQCIWTPLYDLGCFDQVPMPSHTPVCLVLGSPNYGPRAGSGPRCQFIRPAAGN